ncbi:NAD-binding protein [Amylocystis lapponica]|nr:NAD-binding protein [Amylocystis lapponica]
MSYSPPTSSPPVRVAIVTGAAQGLGLAIALRLAQDGLDVAVNDVKEKGNELQVTVSAIQTLGRRALAVCADISSEEEVKTMVATVVDKLGGLDVMVANAGVSAITPILETSVEEWDRIMAVNVRGTMLCYKHAALQMIKQGRGGRLISASSIAGKRALRNGSAYSATKFAIRGLTQSAAQEFAPHSITVNAYAPGFISAPTYTTFASEERRVAGALKKEVGYPADSPDGTSDSIASAVSYLAKPEAYFITGQTLVIDGGIVLT